MTTVIRLTTTRSLLRPYIVCHFSSQSWLPLFQTNHNSTPLLTHLSSRSHYIHKNSRTYFPHRLWLYSPVSSIFSSFLVGIQSSLSSVTTHFRSSSYTLHFFYFQSYCSSLTCRLPGSKSWLFQSLIRLKLWFRFFSHFFCVYRFPNGVESSVFDLLSSSIERSFVTNRKNPITILDFNVHIREWLVRFGHRVRSQTVRCGQRLISADWLPHVCTRSKWQSCSCSWS